MARDGEAAVVTWLVRYFRLRADVLRAARMMQGAQHRFGPETVVSLAQLAEIGRALEELVDGREGTCPGE